MAQQVSSARVTVDINGRRTSLPVFLSDSGKDIPNYLRASIGSCHDYCKYGKETVSVRQHRPWIKETAAASQVVFPTVKSAKISKNGKSKIISDVKISEDSFMSRDEDIKHSAEFTKISGSKLIKEKSFVKKSGAPSGAIKSENLKRVVPAKVETRVGGKTSLDLNKSKRKVSMVNRSRAVKQHDTVAKSPIHPPKKMNAITRPPLPPSPSKLATKGKTSSSSTPPPVTPVAKSKPLPSANQLKTKSVVAHSSSSSATKKSNAATLKASIKKNLNLKDQNTKKRDASKTRVTKDATLRRGSKSHTSNTATNSKGKGLRLEKSVDVKLAETKEFREKNDEVPSHAAESGYQEGMESYDEVPEKTLYVVEMETGNNTKAPSCDEYKIPTHSSLTSQPEVGQDELTDTDKSLPSAEKISDTQLFIPSSTSSCAISNIQDDSTYTESEVDYIIHDDDHHVHGENLKDAENAKVKNSAAVPSEEYNKDPVKLTFRRGTVIDITQQNNAPRRLKFTREHAVEENSFKITEATQDNGTTKNSSGTFVLRHQDVQDTKKDAKILFNNVIEETASKLAETRKSKVKALVGAFETVISLQDRKPAATS